MYNVAVGIVITLLFVCLVVIFCAIIIKLYIIKIKEHNQKELNFQKELNTTIIETQEQVVNNISQDLHDDAGQQLTYINFQLENLKLDSPEWKEALEPVSQSVLALSNSIRSISHSLNNQLIVQNDIIKAITNEVERLQKNKKPKVIFNYIPSLNDQFETKEKIFVYRIFQEIINNCLKHANASIITIELKTNPYFQLTVSDNGKGFDFDSLDKKLTLGLQSMHTRAEIINYSVTIKSVINKGTSIKLSKK
ncbi:MAG: hypothetical protein J0M25_13260 [Flavobacteriales bacterium]|nr:hypothetical protein [Flavobacteriales bacterium]